MDNLESKIIEILKHGTPLRAVNIAQMLGVERREVSIANTAYQKGQLSFWKANRLTIALVSVALNLDTF
ncbi:hypothetical protein ACN23B_05575 [Anabaena sp. FACHB-709]|uniref:Uncharacterized protein n=2 Tax=Nostocaceae TaxID=1162 RepID=A0A1Z4KSY8_ANAVA|nr:MULTISPECIES: hypothetical protein [Nostocaceae]BAY72089.1 hypothetical protein NIES23_49130 [Trichormus variabilis NIES-23]HBW28784.1 hypothetical protein [Nostoc sp. UBA8866]MBD2171473.1 hypothetical protein [Anabaena cylindrica FACHB-318]MBD2263257.1 hypothetical protein [Anabaena sp. FACHB-709]MBD2272802.1 hypothetical protein [Nostoc sp. PCC 7120 = FACHB-418]